MTVSQKHVDLSNGVQFLKSLILFFRRTYALSVDFKMKPLRLKTNSNFTVRVDKRSNHSRYVYLMNHLVQTAVLVNM